MSFLYLHFTDISGAPELKFTCLSRAEKSPVQTSSPTWDEPVQALCLLLIQAAIKSPSLRYQAGLHGMAGSPAAVLSRAIHHDCESLRVIFGPDRQNQPFYKAILIEAVSEARDFHSVLVDRDVLRGVTILRNGVRLTRARDLRKLADEIGERIQQPLAWHERVAMLPQSTYPFPGADTSNAIRTKTDDLSTSEIKSLSALENFGKLTIAAALKRIPPSKRFIVQRYQRTFIEIFNSDGDARIVFQFGILNAGSELAKSRSHIFRFEPQSEEPSFCCKSDRGEDLEVELIRSSATDREMRVKFPKQLGPLERFNYSISFALKREFALDAGVLFYYLTARAPTKHFSLEITLPSDLKFSNVNVSQETGDGFLKDNPPLVTLHRHENKPLMRWQIENPGVGDLFRTFWSLEAADGEVEGNCAQSLTSQSRPKLELVKRS